ncbi:MAG: tetratricopeptide repeat protein [Steroidobacteraceae bacterium]
MRPTPTVLLALALSACAVRGPLPAGGPAGATPGAAPTGSVQGAASPVPVQPPGAPPRPRMGPAATALVGQAHTQAAGGEFAAAGATLERALRIEPDNPLLWVELGRLQLQQGNAGQADGMGRKALALASGDADAQAGAWTLIADSLRARGRNAEAADAERRAATLAPR